MTADKEELVSGALLDPAKLLEKEWGESWTADGRIQRPAWGRIHKANCAEVDAHALAAICRHPPPGLRLFKYGSRSVVGSFQLPSGKEVCLKYYFPKNWMKRMTYGLRGSRCFRSWVAGFALAEAGVSTPAPIAIVEEKGAGGLRLDRAFLATDLASGITLADFVLRHGSDAARLGMIAEKLRRDFARMARARTTHGDLKATNILVDERDEIAFIDLDGVEVARSLAAWKKGRERDERVFAKNWRKEPVLAEVFRDVFR